MATLGEPIGTPVEVGWESNPNSSDMAHTLLDEKSPLLAHVENGEADQCADPIPEPDLPTEEEMDAVVPVSAVPRWLPAKPLALGIAVSMCVLTATALVFDFYFLAIGEDIIDN